MQVNINRKITLFFFLVSAKCLSYSGISLLFLAGTFEKKRKTFLVLLCIVCLSIKNLKRTSEYLNSYSSPGLSIFTSVNISPTSPAILRDPLRSLGMYCMHGIAILGLSSYALAHPDIHSVIPLLKKCHVYVLILEQCHLHSEAGIS